MVSAFLFKDRDGQTPLPSELRKGLIPRHIQTMGELDEFEEQNIAHGLSWLKNSEGDCTRYPFWLKLHKKLFAEVWTWAGEVRKHELNNPDFYLPHQIWPGFKKLEDDLVFWLQEKSLSPNEIVAFFHERIETIHPFANGNGRFGRILVEYFCGRNQMLIPSWGATHQNNPKARRQAYISALDQARHNRDYTALIAFMFS